MAKEEASSVVSDLINFLNSSPTAFHAVGNYSHSLFSILLFVCFLRKSPTREQKILYLKKKKKTLSTVHFLLFCLDFKWGSFIFLVNNPLMFQRRQRSCWEALGMSKFQRERIGNWKLGRDTFSRGITLRLLLLQLVKSMVLILVCFGY